MAVAQPAPPSPDQAVSSALRTLATERDGLAILMEAIGNGLGAVFTGAVDAIASARGRVIVTGMGKSGHVARKIAATLASTGTPAHYVHPAEASHGDLGMVQPDDVIVALSWSGETAELADIIGYAKRYRVPLIALTSNAESTLGRASDICLTLPKPRKPALTGWPPPHRPPSSWPWATPWPSPFSSGAASRQSISGCSIRGGKLGARLKLVRDIMHKDERLPIVGIEARMDQAIDEIGRKGFGAVIVVNGDGTLAGIVTDGDLRRNLRPDLATLPVATIMTKTPRTIAPDALVASALEMEEASRITALIVVENSRPVGLVHYLDLLRAGAA
jgi:arabinose-5-phosphate isomerase